MLTWANHSVIKNFENVRGKIKILMLLEKFCISIRADFGENVEYNDYQAHLSVMICKNRILAKIRF